jgi:hypothetical protein
VPPSPSQPPLRQNEDWFLRSLVLAANAVGDGPRVPITLYVGGTVITGDIVSGLAWFEGLAREIEEHSPKEGSDARAKRRTRSTLPSADQQIPLSRFLRETGERVYHTENASRPPAYIHLADATIVVPNGRPIPAEGGVYWRARLSQIDAFHLGRLEASVASEPPARAND